MKIEAGKFYKARNGALFGPMVWDEDSNLWEANGRSWFNDGKWYRENTKHAHDLIEEVTVNVQFSTFPTWEEFNEWFDDTMNGKALPSEYYEYFHDRVKPLVIGQEYEFSDDGEDWIRLEFNGYHAGQWAYDQIRPIRPLQPVTEPDLLESLRKWQRGDLAFDAMPEVLERAIKALEESK